LIKKLKKM